MKSLLAAFILVPLLSQTALAKRYCDLPDTTAEDSWVETAKAVDLGRMPKAKLLTLPPVTKQQIFFSAHFGERAPAFNDNNFLKAVEMLKDFSEAGDLYLSTFRHGYRKFTYVRNYPGGNEGGYIFSYGSTQMLAAVGDQDISCL